MPQSSSSLQPAVGGAAKAVPAHPRPGSWELNDHLDAQEATHSLGQLALDLRQVIVAHLSGGLTSVPPPGTPFPPERDPGPCSGRRGRVRFVERRSSAGKRSRIFEAMRRRHDRRSDFDSPWKEALEYFLAQ